jgi:hypothetical protein
VHVAGPQVSVGQPLPGLNVPQFAPIAHVVAQVLMHFPDALQAWLAPHAGHVIVPPQPLGAVPQACPAGHVVAGVHPQTFAVPAPPQVCPVPVHVAGPQVSAGQPLPGLNVPQFAPIGHVVGHVLWHWPVASHVVLVGHVPHVTMPPHPSGADPHTALAQAKPGAFGVHMHVPAVLASARTHDVCGAVHAPQAIVPPQPSAAEPQLSFPHACASGVHPQRPAVPPPPHDWGAWHTSGHATVCPQLLVVAAQTAPRWQVCVVGSG